MLGMLVFREITSIEAPKKLSQCNRCRDAGFPGIMIAFENGGTNKTTGKIFWLLKNSDGSDHKHISALNPTITIAAAPPPPPTATTNGTTKEQTIQALHDRRVETELQHIKAIEDQTTTIREQSKLIGDLVGAIWELVQKQQ